MLSTYYSQFYTHLSAIQCYSLITNKYYLFIINNTNYIQNIHLKCKKRFNCRRIKKNISKTEHYYCSSCCDCLRLLLIYYICLYYYILYTIISINYIYPLMQQIERVCGAKLIRREKCSSNNRAFFKISNQAKYSQRNIIKIRVM